MDIDQDIINEATRRYLGKTPDEWAAMESDPSAFHEREVAAQHVRAIVECYRHIEGARSKGWTFASDRWMEGP